MSEKRLSLTPNGNVWCQLKTPCRDGTTHVIFEPMDFIARLAALSPRSRVNLTRFHGVFAPNSKHRVLVTKAKRGRGNKAVMSDEPSTPAEQRAAMIWAQRLKRVFNIDIETCCECGAAGWTVRLISKIDCLAQEAAPYQRNDRVRGIIPGFRKAVISYLQEQEGMHLEVRVRKVA